MKIVRGVFRVGSSNDPESLIVHAWPQQVSSPQFSLFTYRKSYGGRRWAPLETLLEIFRGEGASITSARKAVGNDLPGPMASISNLICSPGFKPGAAWISNSKRP